MEIRQLRYVVTVAEELHFGHAAAREHIVQSALSQQVRRLEREIGVPLFLRSTHHVALTPAGEIFVGEVRRILNRLERAVEAARTVRPPASLLRVGIGDPSFDSMPRILRTVECMTSNPLEVHRVEAGVSEQCRMLNEERLDVGFGFAAVVPPGVAAELVRVERLGVVVDSAHPYAALEAVPVARLKAVPLLLVDQEDAPRAPAFIVDLFRAGGIEPTLYRGSVQSVQGAVDLIERGRCVACLPASCRLPTSVTWVPLSEPEAYSAWSLLWSKECDNAKVDLLREAARSVGAAESWLKPPFHDRVMVGHGSQLAAFSSREDAG